MTRVLLATVRLLEFMEGAGHFWAYMQYAQALQRLGCDVYVLDSSIWSDAPPDERRVREFRDRMERYGLRDKVIVAGNGTGIGEGRPPRAAGRRRPPAQLQLPPEPGRRVRRPAQRARRHRPGIAPVLDQSWIHLSGDPRPLLHDRRDRRGRFRPDPRLRHRVAPDSPAGLSRPVALHVRRRRRGVHDRVVVVGRGGLRRRRRTTTTTTPSARPSSISSTFPRHTDQPLELALFLAASDEADRRSLEERGWRVRHSPEVAGSPEGYRAYVQKSRGEFSWAKASCARFQNAWISDRSLCYLASGKPVVVQDTGTELVPSERRGHVSLPHARRCRARLRSDQRRLRAPVWARAPPRRGPLRRRGGGEPASSNGRCESGGRGRSAAAPHQRLNLGLVDYRRGRVVHEVQQVDREAPGIGDGGGSAPRPRRRCNGYRASPRAPHGHGTTGIIRSCSPQMSSVGTAAAR